jgi:phosphotransferase system IIB component
MKNEVAKKIMQRIFINSDNRQYDYRLGKGVVKALEKEIQEILEQYENDIKEAQK